MFRRREGTGALYADNRRRAPRSGLRRVIRTSAMQRANNQERPWLQEGADLENLDNVEVSALVEATRSAVHVLFELLEDVGGYVQRCRRLRQPMPADVVADMADLLDWYVVLFTVGLCDRQGVWLAARPVGPGRPPGTRGS